MRVCVFPVGSHRCALPLTAVRETALLPEWFPVPLPLHRCGLALLRGKVLTVVDRSTDLGFAPLPSDAPTWSLLLDLPDRDVALLTTGMPRIEELEGELLPPPDGLPVPVARMLHGVLLEEGEVVHLLDPSALAEPWT